jgi:ribosomal protein S18 acetylase RimI-like enzyme
METLVAESESGAIGGFVVLAARAPYGDEGEHTLPIREKGLGSILALYVAPENWRCGCGRALLRAATERLEESGCTAAGVWVLHDNAAARDFYRSSDFLATGVVGSHRPTEAAEIHLRRDLGS